MMLLGDLNASPIDERWGYAKCSFAVNEDYAMNGLVQEAYLIQIFPGTHPQATWQACEGPQRAILDRTFVSYEIVSPIQVTVQIRRTQPASMFDIALIVSS
jgi:hypothetical protein